MSERSSEVHYVSYHEVDGRQYWECRTCSSGGSVGEFGDPELAAEEFHGFPVATVWRPDWDN
jgi:hypothetical protein